MQKILALLLLALMMACQTTSPAASNPTPDPNSVSSDIKASDGGEVKLENGVSLKIPATKQLGFVVQ